VEIVGKGEGRGKLSLPTGLSGVVHGEAKKIGKSEGRTIPTLFSSISSPLKMHRNRFWLRLNMYFSTDYTGELSGGLHSTCALTSTNSIFLFSKFQ